MKYNFKAGVLIFIILTSLYSCSSPVSQNNKIPVIIDTDANNELDDQQALAYLFFNDSTFDIAGVTVNATSGGGNIDEQYNEAKRVMQLCSVFDKIPSFKGANGNFSEIRTFLKNDTFDGSDAVNFIIEQSNKPRKEKLVLLPVGKLTNIALALEKEPSISEKIKIVWLGSNYPESGEYNLENDIEALNFILTQDVPFEMVTVRYGKETGSGFVMVTPGEISAKMPGLGPRVNAVEGRHGGLFTCFGDYSVDLFKNCELYNNPPSRSLYDMTAVAILKNPAFGETRVIHSPVYLDGKWEEIKNDDRPVIIWENFNRDAIMEDFFQSMKNFTPSE